ncbi:LysR family transcriptional regulator [Amphibiibacter pelophylacis]|uniref:LysR family transcriptional regulator n=1 Tax=Amphibiibacter pelophylacis TaxID=1799477 RepID=A0ACC6P116_9BURK
MAFTLRQLKYFVTAAELGQISQAGVQLNISQSAITTAVRDLEAFLGNTLFDRTSSGVVLTPMGRRFLSHAYEVLDAADRAMAMPNQESTISGRVKVAVTPTVMGYFLPTHLQRVGQLHPKLQVEIEELTRPAIEEALVRGQVDVGLLLTDNIQRTGDINSEVFFGSPMRVWMATGHELASGNSTDMKDVARHPLIMLNSDEAEEAAMRNWRHFGLEPSVVLRTSSIEAVRSMAANGVGVAVLPDMIYRPWSLEGRRIETRPIEDDLPPMNVGMAWNKAGTPSAVATAFMDYFRHFFFSPNSGNSAW